MSPAAVASTAPLLANSSPSTTSRKAGSETLHLTLEGEGVEDEGRPAHAGGGAQDAAQAAYQKRNGCQGPPQAHLRREVDEEAACDRQDCHHDLQGHGGDALKDEDAGGG